MKKKNFIIIIIVLIVVLFFYLAFAWGKGIWPFSTTYQVVTLVNGEVYYGRFSSFPSPKIVDAWLFQQTPAQEEEGADNVVDLIPFTSLFFAPKNVIYLEKSQILWWSDLEKDSAIIQLIEAKSEAQSLTPSTEQLPQKIEEGN